MDVITADVLSTVAALQRQQQSLEDAVPQLIHKGDSVVRWDVSHPSTRPRNPHLKLDLHDDPRQGLSWQTDAVAATESWSEVIDGSSLATIALENPSTIMSTPTSTSTGIDAAWEVDEFRWPRVAKLFLAQYHALFDHIGNSLWQSLEPGQGRLGICSSARREGKSTLAICLAQWAREQGRRTLIIDADLANPQLSYMSGLTPDFGWKSIFKNDMPVSEVMVRSAVSQLTLMPLAWDKHTQTQSKMLDKLCSVVAHMKHEFDLVVMDLGTIESLCSHLTAGMDLVDQMLVVRDSQHTTTGQLMETRQVLENLGFSKTAVAENFARKAG